MIRIGISGFGRIGRLAARVALRRGDMEVVAINAPDKTPEQIAYVFSHDSVHGKWEGTVSYDEHHLIVDGKPILLLSSRDPSTLGWGELNVPYVVECTGKFLTKPIRIDRSIASILISKLHLRNPVCFREIILLLSKMVSHFGLAKKHR